MTLTFERMISVTYYTQVLGVHTITINIKTFPFDKYHFNPTVAEMQAKEFFSNLGRLSRVFPGSPPQVKIRDGSQQKMLTFQKLGAFQMERRLEGKNSGPQT